ncbi:chromosomal replication initiator protein [Desulfacinum hydrothermale DSM 13146]|uniref:Chromosomal replication initiator protein DnaA n=1 Tax=Desulfacinum hydrothermale DSM 13146 TaxID=1121390 RepID=A0A1W1XWA3_9BACT|nr:chromosomal replication initiator protein DnaA [Desulfacinum hydrothermale]SMC28270.1 chromosomal replication initiator protein [Desulfacinum hydrothermale DSM 13146]
MLKEWEAVQEGLKEGLSRGQYDLWVATLRFLQFDGHELVLGCRNALHRDWVQSHLVPRIVAVGRDRFSGLKKVRLELVRQDPLQEKDDEEEWQPPEEAPRQMSFADIGQKPRSPFNPRFTFDQFVVGRSNHFAYATCLAMAGQQNLFNQSIYLMADPGLGKSHLTHAVGNLLTTSRPDIRVRYVTAEQFANEMIRALKRDRIEDFKRRYRDGCDVLLLEKVEFFSGKRKIQDELVYTLDELLDRGRRIICTGKTAPQDIPRLNHELRSRLGGVLVAPIERPDFATRKEIIQRKAAHDGVELPMEVAEFLADRITSDVRQLESCLVGILAKSSILGIPITLELAREVTQSILDSLPSLGIPHIAEAVCANFGVSMEELRSRARHKKISEARQLAMYLCRKYTSEPLNAIAQAFGRSHSTVIYALKKMDRELARKNSQLRKRVEHVAHRIETRCLDG